MPKFAMVHCLLNLPVKLNSEPISDPKIPLQTLHRLVPVPRYVLLCICCGEKKPLAEEKSVISKLPGDDATESVCHPMQRVTFGNLCKNWFWSEYEFNNAAKPWSIKGGMLFVKCACTNKPMFHRCLSKRMGCDAFIVLCKCSDRAALITCVWGILVSHSVLAYSVIQIYANDGNASCWTFGIGMPKTKNMKCANLLMLPLLPFCMCNKEWLPVCRALQEC